MNLLKSFKRVISLMLALTMMFSIVGCTQQPVDEVDKTDVHNDGDINIDNDIDGVEEVTEIIITDHLGREVKIEGPVERIVSGYYISSSMLIALGLEDRVVGIEAKPEIRAIYELAAPTFLELPTVGSVKEFDLEGAAALKPDLLVLSVRHKDSVESLENLGLNVVAINPESMEELEEALDIIGKVTDTEERANKLKEYYSKKTEELTKLIEGRERKDIYFAGNSDVLTTASSKMYQGSIISNAGGNNVAADIDDTYWATISYEQLISYNPDVIIGAAGASYSADDIKNDDKLKSIKAVENGDVYIIPSRFELWDSPIPSGIIGTMWVTSILHEEVYPFDKFKDEASDFYKEFYGVEIDKNEISK